MRLTETPLVAARRSLKVKLKLVATQPLLAVLAARGARFQPMLNVSHQQGLQLPDESIYTRLPFRALFPIRTLQQRCS